MADRIPWEHLAQEAKAIVSDDDEARQIVTCLECLRSLLGTPETCPPALARVIQEIYHGPHPAGATSLLERYVGAFRSPQEFLALVEKYDQSPQVLGGVFGYSEFLANVLIRHPNLLWDLLATGELSREKDYASFHTEATQCMPHWSCTDECRDALCRWKYAQLLRLGLRDVLGYATIEHVTREISDIAQACIEVAAKAAWNDLVARYGVPLAESDTQPEHPAGMCVLGMGKLGGRELNFSSDIDLVFIYDHEGWTTGNAPEGRRGAVISNHEFFNKMGQTIVRFLSSRGPEGYLFRVDMRLRPEGKSGPLARSFESFVNYLEVQARDWERLAYLKARVLTGPAPLANRLYLVMGQFVFETAEPARLISEIERLKLMIDREVLVSDVYHREVKRGYGGIREIEFIIAAMQIVYGQMHAALRVRNIFLAIDRLAQVNILSRKEADFYLHAYSFLRLIEHRLQMAQEHQTHLIPSQPQELLVLARRCGFDSVEVFQKTYSDITDQVHARFTAFFQRNIEAEAQQVQEVLALLDDDADLDEALSVLSRYGIGTEHAFRLIRDLAHGTREIFVSAQGQKYFEQMLPSLLRLIARAPNPEKVLPHLHSFVLAVKGITYYYELIANHPDVLRLLVLLFGSSDYFSEVLCAHPEFFDALLTSRLLHEASDRPTVSERIAQTVGKRGSCEKRSVALRRAVKFEQLIIALRHLLGLRPLITIFEELTVVADVALEQAWTLALEAFSERQRQVLDSASGEKHVEKGLAGPPRVTVFAVGKYGGRELNFFADLDVIYVWDDLSQPSPRQGDGLKAAIQLINEFVAVVTEHRQEGRLFQLDARLRPDGRNSAIVTPLSYFLQYLNRKAEIWELLALSRLRFVLGQEGITEELVRAVRERIAQLPPADIRQHVSQMRWRLEQSVGTSRAATHEFKRSAGGMVDVEFLLQYWQLTGALPLYGEQLRSYLRLFVSPPHPLPCEEHEWRFLGESYAFLRRLETAVRVVVKDYGTRLPSDEAQLRAVTRIIGEEEPNALVERLEATKSKIRRLFCQFLPEVMDSGAKL